MTIKSLILISGYMAACFNSTAAAIEPVSIREIQSMSFGAIPASGVTRCILKKSGQLKGGCIGLGQLGEMQIKGEPFYAYSVTVSTHGWVNQVKLIPKLPNQDYFLNKRGKDTTLIRGIFRKKDSYTQGGVIHMTYTFTVNYQ